MKSVVILKNKMKVIKSIPSAYTGLAALFLSSLQTQCRREVFSMAYMVKKTENTDIHRTYSVSPELKPWFQVTGDLDDFLFFYEDDKTYSEK
jgi:hypothetical protein